MKLIDPRSLFLGLLGLLTISIVPAQGQMAPGGAPMPGLDAALLKIFGADATFTATSHLDMKGQGQNVQMKMKLLVLNGKTRTEMDMADIQGAAIPPMAMAQIKNLGMDKITTLLLGGGKTNVIIYPGMKAYVVTSNPGSGDCAIDKKNETEEAVDGVKMTRRDFEVDCDGLAKQSFTTWTEGSNSFPTRLHTEQDGMSVTIRLADIDKSKPDAKLFERPEGFEHYDSMVALMTGVQQKMLQQQLGN